MPRNDALKHVWIKLLLGLTFVGLGIWVVSLAIDMVGDFGESMGATARSRQIYSRAHIAVHLFGTAASVAVGLFILGRNKTLAVFAMAAIIACGGYGIVNMIGFTTTNRLSVSEAKEASNSADWKHYEAQRAAIQSDIKWAQNTEISTIDPREKRRLFARIDAKTKELATILPPKPTAATVLADPQATWFARLTGSASDKWQLALPVPVAILLFAAEVLSFVFAVHLLAGAIEAWRSAGSGEARKNSDGSDGSGGSGKLRIVEPARTKLPEPAKRAEPNNSRSVMSSVHFSTDAPKGKLSKSQLHEELSQLAHANRKKSTRAIAAQTKWSQSTVSREQRKLRGKQQRTGRWQGNGGGMQHALASG